MHSANKDNYRVSRQILSLKENLTMKSMKIYFVVESNIMLLNLFLNTII